MSEAEISIGYYEGPTQTVIEALVAARLDGAMLELEGDVSEALEGFVETINRAHPELADANRRATEAFEVGPIRFGIGPHLTPIEGDNLARLAAHLADGYSFFVELGVRDDDGYLVRAHDVSNGEIWVSDRVPEEAVARMREVLGEGLRPAPRGPDEPA